MEQFSYETLFYVLGFLITFAGCLFGVWKYFSGQLDETTKDIAVVRQELNDHKIKSAELYATKDSLEARFDRVMELLKDIQSRLDKFYEMIAKK